MRLREMKHLSWPKRIMTEAGKPAAALFRIPVWPRLRRALIFWTPSPSGGVSLRVPPSWCTRNWLPSVIRDSR